MNENRLQAFLKSEEYNYFSLSAFTLLSKINLDVFEMLIKSDNHSLLKKSTILNGVQKVGVTSTYFGIEYAFYSDEADLLQANCININCGLRDSGDALLVSFSMNSIHEEIDLFELNYSRSNWETKVLDGKYIRSEILRLISEFIEKTKSS